MSTLSLEQAILQDCETDRISDDVTAKLLKEAGEKPCKATILSREAGVFSGASVVRSFQKLFPEIRFELLAKEGEKIQKGSVLVRLSGETAKCLSLERTLLNYLSHVCGVATLTSRFVEKAKEGTKILATRKTLPGLRDLQLTAVVAGGGHIHRRSLSDGILIKDNHIAMADIKTLLIRAEEIRSPLHRVEIEVQNLSQLEEALLQAPDVVMLDNMSVEEMQKAVKRIREISPIKTKIEVSGGVNLETVGRLAELDVDYISVGQLTHSVTSLNLTMDFSR